MSPAKKTRAWNLSGTSRWTYVKNITHDMFVDQTKTLLL